MGPLRHPGFRLLFAGQLVSNLGDAIYSVALSWYVLSHHGGALLLGTVLAAYGIPRAGLLLVGGHASDRLRPWTVMLAANCVRAVAVVAMALAASSGATREVVLVPIALVLGAGEGMFLPGSFAVVPALLDVDELQQGNALASGTTEFSLLAGPALGGILVALAGAASCFWLDALSFVVSAATLVGVRAHAPSTATAVPIDRQTVGTTPPKLTLRRLIATEPILMLVLITDAILNLGTAGMARVALPTLAKEQFHAGAGGYGMLLAAFGAGLLIGTVGATGLPTVRRPLLASSLVLLVSVPSIAAVPYLGGPIPAGAALLISAVLAGLSNVLFTTAFQRWAPAHLMGRVMALLMLASIGMLPISVLLAGLVVDTAGPATYFPLLATSVAVAAALPLGLRTWRDFGARPRHPPAPVMDAHQ